MVDRPAAIGPASDLELAESGNATTDRAGRSHMPGAKPLSGGNPACSLPAEPPPPSDRPPPLGGELKLKIDPVCPRGGCGAPLLFPNDAAADMRCEGARSEGNMMMPIMGRNCGNASALRKIMTVHSQQRNVMVILIAIVMIIIIIILFFF